MRAQNFMTDTLLPPVNLPPIVATLPELKRVLLPITLGYKWGENTITDLWKLGAPMPPSDGRPANGDERLIVPSQLIKWLEDVLNRQGRPLSDSAKLYAQMVTEGH